MTPDEILQEMRVEFTTGRGTARRVPRTYVGGLLVSFADFLLELGPSEERPGFRFSLYNKNGRCYIPVIRQGDFAG